MWGSVAVLALPIAFDPVRLGVNLLLISRPRPAQNLLVYWVGCVTASVMLLLLPLLALHFTDLAWVHDLANPRTTASATMRHAQVFVGVLLVPGIPVLAQAAAFVVLSFVSIQVYRKWFRKRERQSDQPALNRRSAALVGRVVALEQAIVDGRGRVQIADAYWDVTGPDLPAGASVRIVGGDAMSLQVVAA